MRNENQLIYEQYDNSLATQTVYNENGYEVKRIHTPAQATKYAKKGTNWSTKFPKWSRKYLQDGPLYVVLKDGMPVAQAQFETSNYANERNEMLNDPIVKDILKQVQQAEGR